MVYNLIYRSRATEALGAAQLTSLLERARTFNLSQGLTGLLLYTPDQQFLQVLEGDQHAVRAVYYGHIVADPRHADCWVLSQGFRTHRSFPDWHMGFLAHQHMDLSTKPGFFEISRLRHVRSLLEDEYPALSQLLLEFDEHYSKVN